MPGTQTIPFDPECVDPILDGHRNATIRVEPAWYTPRKTATLVTPDGIAFATATIDTVARSTLVSIADLLGAMGVKYPHKRPGPIADRLAEQYPGREIDITAVVTVIKFTDVAPLDRSDQWGDRRHE